MDSTGTKLRAIVGVALVMAVIGVACAKSQPSTSGGGGSQGTTQGGGGYGGRYGGGSQGTGSSSSGGPVALTVSQVNYQFNPSTITVASGATIAVKDATTGTPHTFTVTGQSVDLTNNPGQTQDVVMTLPAGTYTFFCKFHQSLGMTGTLVVT